MGAAMVDEDDAPFVDTRSRVRVVRPRGDVGRALADGARLLRHIGPETPRPLDLLTAVSGDEGLTAREHVLWELLVSAAYQRAYNARRTGAPVVVGTEISIPLRDVAAYLGSAARRADVVASVSALVATRVSVAGIRGRRFQFPMLAASEVEDGDVRFTLPTALWTLLATQRRYAYLEIDSLARMSSRHAVRLYKHLAAHASVHGLRWSTQCSDWTLEVPARETALALGLPEGSQGGRVRETLTRCLPDLENVRAFSVTLGEPRRRAARGAPVEAYRLILRAKEPNPFAWTASAYDPERAALLDGRDAPTFRVAGHVWRKASTLGGSILTPMLHAAWLMALDEALSGSADKDCVRRYRGSSLLREVEDRGASRAAFAFLAEEAVSPDLTRLGLLDGHARSERARASALARWKDHKATAPKIAGPKKERTNPVRLRRVTGLARLAVEDHEGGRGVVLRLGPGRSRHEARLHAPESFAEAEWTGTRLVEIFAECVSLAEQKWVRVSLGSHPASEADLDRIVNSIGLLFTSWRHDDPAFDETKIPAEELEDWGGDDFGDVRRDAPPTAHEVADDALEDFRLSPPASVWFAVPAGSHLDCDEFADDERDEDEDDLTLGVPDGYGDDDFEEPSWL